MLEESKRERVSDREQVPVVPPHQGYLFSERLCACAPVCVCVTNNRGVVARLLRPTTRSTYVWACVRVCGCGCGIHT